MIQLHFKQLIPVYKMLYTVLPLLNSLHYYDLPSFNLYHQFHYKILPLL